MSNKVTSLYNYVLRNVRVVDGDTLEADIDLGFGVALTGIKVRLTKIDCPEMSSQEGVNARVFTKNWVESKYAVQIVVSVKNHKKDKYGRILGAVTADGEDLAQALMDAGHAIGYVS
jgi:micrococcal nuclease